MLELTRGALYLWYIFLGQIDCNNEKKIVIINWVLKTQFKLSFLTPFSGGKKMLGKTPDGAEYFQKGGTNL